MARFLHIADIHLGFDHYDNKERTKDFYLALKDVLKKHAIEAQVDFVVIAGDLFEHRTIQPAILNQAKDCFLMLKEAGITTIADANAFLPGYLARHNARFRVPPADPTPAWRPWPTGLSAEAVFAFWYERTVGRDDTIAWDGGALALPRVGGTTGWSPIGA